MRRNRYIALGVCVLAVMLTSFGCADEAVIADGAEPKAEAEFQEPPAEPDQQPQLEAKQQPRPEAEQQAQRDRETPPPELLLRNLKAGIAGRWLFRTEAQSFTIQLSVEDEELSGSLTTPGDSPVAIKVGVFSGDAFLFEIAENGTEWLWSGQFSSEGLQGRRENLETGTVETFKAVRSQ